MGLFFKSTSEKTYEALHDKVLARCKSIIKESPTTEPYEVVLAIWTEEMEARGATIYAAPKLAAPLLKFPAVLDPFDGMRMLAQLIAAHMDEKFRDTKYGMSLDQNLGTLVRVEKTTPDELNQGLQRQSPNAYAALCRELGKKPFYPGSIDDHASRLFMRSVVASMYGADAYGRRVQ